MDFRTVFQLRSKKVWWLDVIFYFVVSLLMATIICYFVFVIKNAIQKQEIEKLETDLLLVGTDEQKEQEAQVILYKKKINDFTKLIENHEFASNVFAFMEENSQPNVWFRQFNLDAKNSQVQLTGETESMDAFSRQTATFEKNEYVKNLGTLNSSATESSKINFNFSLTLKPEIFSYILNTKNKEKIEKEENIVVISSSLAEVTNLSEEDETENQQEGEEIGIETEKSSEKQIFSFDIPLNPEVIGMINQANHTILISLPPGTNFKNITPIIFFSDKATVYPESNTPQDFSNPIIYKVTAEDGSIQEYMVTARISQAQQTIENQEKSGLSGIVKMFLVIAGVSFMSIIGLTIFLLIKNKIISATKK